MNTILTLQLIACIATAALGVFVVYQKPRLTAARFFGVFALSTALWNLALFMAISTYGQPTLWGRLAISFGSFMPAGFFLFLTVFPWRDRHARSEHLGTALLSGTFFLLPLLGAVVRSARSVDHHYLTGELGTGYKIFWLYYLAALAISFIKSLRKYKQVADPHHRVQLWYVTFGCMLFFVPLICTQFILPAFGIFTYNSLGPVFAIPMLVCISYAIVRHRLLDIRVIVQRSLIYIIFIICAIAIYATGVELLGKLLKETTDFDILFSAGITMTLGIFCWEPVRAYLIRVTDPIFFKDPYDYAIALRLLTDALRKNISEQDIIAAATPLLEHIFKAKDVCMYTDVDAVPSETSAAVSVPIVYENRTIGHIRLGAKRSGEIYTDRDMQLLETFSWQAAVALEKGRLFAQVETYSAKMEALVAVRTAELQKLQEEQRQAMVDISHNLQTPLAVLRGELESEGREAASESLDRVSSFIRQLLRVARLDSSAHTVEFTFVDLSTLVREQAEYAEIMAEEAGVTLVVDVPPDTYIRGNKRLLGELLLNLIGNAIKYKAPDRAGRVQIVVVEDITHVTLTVADNGIGIPEDELPDLFTRFYRSSKTRGVFPGTGLGLSIVRSIAEKHGAHISAANNASGGATFTIRFPKQSA